MEQQTAKEIKKPVKIQSQEKTMAQASWEALKEEEAKTVRGKFIYHECPGGVMEFTFRKFKGNPLESYSLKDGEVYTIPLAVARHLNTNCWYPTYTFKNDEQGRPTTSVGEKVHRTAFQSLDYF